MHGSHAPRGTTSKLANQLKVYSFCPRPAQPSSTSLNPVQQNVTSGPSTPWSPQVGLQPPQASLMTSRNEAPTTQLAKASSCFLSRAACKWLLLYMSSPVVAGPTLQHVPSFSSMLATRHVLLPAIMQQTINSYEASSSCPLVAQLLRSSLHDPSR